jgi:hypothetical protein
MNASIEVAWIAEQDFARLSHACPRRAILIDDRLNRDLAETTRD